MKTNLFSIYFRIAFFSSVALGLPFFSIAQTGGQGNDIELSKYNNTINFPKPPLVQFSGLNGRVLVSSPEMKFVADNDIVITFDVTIGSDGKVQYVRPHFCKAEFNEYRKGGINYLYASKFTTVPDSEDGQRVTAVFTFPGVEFPEQQESTLEE